MAVQLFSNWWKFLEQIYIYVSYCFSEPMQAPVCRPFWLWAMIGALVFSVLTVLTVIWKIVSYKFKLAAALRAQAERERVDQDAIEAKKWEGDNANRTDEYSSDEIDARVRNAVNAHRARNTPFKPDIV